MCATFYVYVWILVYMYVCLHQYMCVFIWVHVCIYTVKVYVCLYVCTCMCVCVCTHACVLKESMAKNSIQTSQHSNIIKYKMIIKYDLHVYLTEFFTYKSYQVEKSRIGIGKTCWNSGNTFLVFLHYDTLLFSFRKYYLVHVCAHRNVYVCMCVSLLLLSQWCPSVLNVT